MLGGLQGGSNTGRSSTATSPWRRQRRRPPTTHKLKKGETLILDYSVVVQGYRSDFTNTLVVGKEPTPEQVRLFGLCAMAMEAGERELKSGARARPCTTRCGVFAAAGVADYFTTHAGHGLGRPPEGALHRPHSTESLVPAMS